MRQLFPNSVKPLLAGSASEVIPSQAGNMGYLACVETRWELSQADKGIVQTTNGLAAKAVVVCKQWLSRFVEALSIRLWVVSFLWWINQKANLSTRDCEVPTKNQTHIGEPFSMGIPREV